MSNKLSHNTDPGMRQVTSIDEIRPLTPDERKRALAALASATQFRLQLRERYGEFQPPSGEFLREIRTERTERLPRVTSTDPTRQVGVSSCV
jgi:hypothetical protein